MAEVSEDSSSSAKVRDLIFAYERQSSSIEPLEYYEGRQRAKSIGNALSYKLFRQPNLEIHNILDIEKELVKIEAHLNYYEVYDKETHVAFQEQLFNVLTSIVGIDPEGHESTIQIKRKLIGETQKLARVLNGKLPFDGNHSYRGVRRTYSNVVRKEEAIVSTTSVRTQEHTAVLSSSQSTLNGGFISEESLNSTKDSVDLSTRQEDSLSVDCNKVEERPHSATPPPQKKIVTDAESSYVPSVSKLKKFFSFRRDTRPEVNVISAAYSGVSRSQSLNLKSNKYTAIKREKHEERKKKEEIISENDEDIEDPNNQRLITSSPIYAKDDTLHENNQQGNVDISLYVEPASEIEEYREVQRGSQHNVSVSKLKSLFEDKRKETDEGNYMNFTGLLRNVDIHKHADLNKSKSMSDLKSDNFRYELKDIDIDEDLSKEIDDDDDFEHVSISVGKGAEELNNNNIAKAAETLHATHISEGQEFTNQTSETFISGKVGVLKKSFESRTTGSIIEHKNEDIKHLIHRTIDPITNAKNQSEEPPLKVPIQLRTGFTHVSHSKEVVENKSSDSTAENVNNDIEHIIHRTVDPIPNSSSKLDEPVLKIPIQLRAGFTHVSHSEEISGNSTENKVAVDNKVESASNEPEPILKGSFQLKVGVVNESDNEKTKVNVTTEGNVIKVEESVTTGTVDTLKQTFENRSTGSVIEHKNEDIKHLIHRTIDPIPKLRSKSEEPLLKIPIQLRTGFTNVSHSEEVVESSNSDSVSERVNKDIEHLIHRTVEPIASKSGDPDLKIPIQLRTGFTRVSHSEEITGNNIENKVVKEVEDASIASEPILKIPIQLRIGEVNTSHIEGNATTESNEHIFKAEENVTSGTVETLKQTFENVSTEGNEYLVKAEENVSSGTVETLKQTFENSSDNKVVREVNGTSDPSEPILKIPIQLRVGGINTSHIEENVSTESNEYVVVKAEENVSSGTVETLKQTFENSSDNKVVKEVDDSSDTSEPILKIPIQLRVGGINTSHIEENASTESNEYVIKAEENESSGTVETLKQPFENSSGNVVVREVEDSSDISEPILKIPIQLRVGELNTSHSEGNVTTENTEYAVKAQENVSSGTVETLKQTFEQLGTRNGEGNDEEIHHVLHRTIQPISMTDTSSEEPVLKIPIQLRTGTSASSYIEEQVVEQSTSLSGNTSVEIKDQEKPLLKIPVQINIDESNSQDTSNEERSNSAISSVEHSANISSGSVEVLKQTFENLSRSNSQDSSDDVKNVIHRTIETVAYNTDVSDESELKIPIQIRTGLVTSEEVLQNKNGDTALITHNKKIIVANSQEPKSEKAVLRVPIQLRIEGDTATYDHTFIEKGEAVPISLYNGSQSIAEGATHGRAEIESKTQSFMKILESPTAFSTLVTSSSYGQSQQVSSSSKMSVSYSQKRTVQHTSSTQVSHRIVSSSSSSQSSDLLSQNYLQVLKDPYSALPSRISDTSNDEDTVTITEVEDDDHEEQPKINLNVSQENIIDEILKDTDSLENVDEEFEKMLQENK